MADMIVTPFGSWRSPITAADIATGTIRLGQVAVSEDDIYWVEGRPTEGGRNVLVRRSAGGNTLDLTPAPFDVRSRVHEYGGGAFWLADDTVFFVNFEDQRIYRQDHGEEPRAVTPPNVALRYADGVVDVARGRLICVREDHTVAGREPLNSVVSIMLGGGDEGGQLLVMGDDFYASPRLSPDGERLAWLTWNHPNMPWDGVELWVGLLDEKGKIVEKTLAAGGLAESIFQPTWAPDGDLYFISDRSGWWNLYRWRDGWSGPMLRRQAEFGVPQWLLGMSTYGFTADGRLHSLYFEEGQWHLATIDPATGDFQPLSVPYTEMSGLQTGDDFLVLRAGSPTEMNSVIRIDLATQQIATLRRADSLEIESGLVSMPEALEFTTAGGKTAHAYFYPPTNPSYKVEEKEQPPLLVMSHGGPTGRSGAALNPAVQFWTSRGIAVLDVNYGGSTGYGREYRERLKGRWGIVDVEDCINAARYLVKRGVVDGDRLAIRGGSAGGYTTLCALTFREFFDAGASYFGVSDAQSLAEETHKFESRYLDSLIGPYPAAKEVYRERSPIHHVEQLACPVIFFQGLEDRVVPPKQAELMFDALRAKGVPTAYLAFAGEQHGFRREQTIRRTLEAELYFYGRIFGFEPADTIEPVTIANLKG